MRSPIVLAIAGALLVLFAVGASSQSSRIAQLLPWSSGPALVDTELLPGVAIAGHDPVAYFTDGVPKAGSKEITLSYQGATWRFLSVANRDRFKADPQKYAPQFGGHCSWAVANGYTAKGDPQAWKIVDGKLYLNYDLEIKKRWETDIPGFIAKADGNWPKLTTRR